MKKDKLKELRKLRERAGIKFDKSFRCQDAEKNVHLFDKEKFFKKIKERLLNMGYVCSDDFEFWAIAFKFKYAERHHVGQGYKWKYFYSSTFEISQEIVDYLLRHNFIFPKEEQIKQEVKQQEERQQNSKTKENKPKKPKKEWTVAQQEERVERYKQHILNFNEKIKEYKKLNDEKFLKNYIGAKKQMEEKLVSAIRKLEEMKSEVN